MLCMAFASSMLTGCGEKADVTPAESTVSVSETALMSAKTPYGTFRLIPEIYEKNTAMLDRITEHGGDICALYISPDGSDDERRAIMHELKSLADEICRGIDDPAEQAKAICKWTAENISYDRDAAETSVDEYTISLENIFHNGYKTTCGGYSNTVSALCGCMGIYCVNFRGGTASGGYTRKQLAEAPINHEWNGVKIDGEWLFLDTTWYSGKYYSGGEYSEQEEIPFYGGFDLEQMTVEHRIDIADHRDFSDWIE